MREKEELLSDERARAERGRDSVQVVVEGAVERGGDSVQEVVERAVGARERYAGTLRSGVHRSGDLPPWRQSLVPFSLQSCGCSLSQLPGDYRVVD